MAAGSPGEEVRKRRHLIAQLLEKTTKDSKKQPIQLAYIFPVFDSNLTFSLIFILSFSFYLTPLCLCPRRGRRDGPTGPTTLSTIPHSLVNGHRSRLYSPAKSS